MGERLLKTRELAQLLGIEMSTVLDHFERGDIPGFRLYGRKGGPVRFRESEIKAWLDERCRVGTLPEELRNAPAIQQDPGADTDERTVDARPTLRPVDRG
jgi:excisionase family DNA binding protein